MPISDLEIAEFERRGFKQLFENQFRPMPPRHFPPELERHTIPPIHGQLIDQTKTPLYLLGWLTTGDEFASRYGPRCDCWNHFSSLHEKFRELWAVEHPIYTCTTKKFRPRMVDKGIEGDYVMAVTGNYGENHLRQSLDDDFVKAAMDFLGYQDPPKWIRI